MRFPTRTLADGSAEPWLRRSMKSHFGAIKKDKVALSLVYDEVPFAGEGDAGRATGGRTFSSSSPTRHAARRAICTRPETLGEPLRHAATCLRRNPAASNAASREPARRSPPSRSRASARGRTRCTTRRGSSRRSRRRGRGSCWIGFGGLKINFDSNKKQGRNHYPLSNFFKYLSRLFVGPIPSYHHQ